jgi:hypothetical protein
MVRPLPEGVTCIRAPEEAELLDVANEAATKGLFLITDGRETVLSPIVMPGWHRMGVSVKEAA